ncbi:hypothetical protein DIS24_g11669 [Lasiodiplodia hormozganensis]|uniref:37S ribosomal protein S35 n=1 Tax=Lasiodiplodia hormozganensis TaxID=869390 RepID=A0AA39WNG0_9PEZI|nr:hypothetical protein DIS24_g11669 [Lasiodiplodia hormozganensis]
MYNWLNGPGAKLRHPLPGSTNYLGAYDKQGNLLRATAAPTRIREDGEEGGKEEEPSDGGLESRIDSADKDADAANNELPRENRTDLTPFPLNKQFYSQPVLSEELRERIYKAVVEDNLPLSIASTSYKVSMERVAAVVRLKTMEKQWEEQGKPMAKPYSKAVLGMLPTTWLARNLASQPEHESIADLPVHPATRQQLFWPTSESRRFTRTDAAAAFAPGLLPADKRIPHPDLVAAERDEFAGLAWDERIQRQHVRNARHAQEKLKREAKAREVAARTTRVPGRRWDFKIQDFSIEQVGRDGKNPGGVGWRYGAPHEDRKRGQIKIPKKVDV